MSALANARHERFAQERAKGLTVDAAYEAAGFKVHRGNAHRLSTNDSVASRVAELQAVTADAAVVTAADLSAQLEDLRVKAVQAGQFGAAVQAVNGRAKLHGLIIDKAEVKDVTNIEPEQRQAEIRRLTAKLRVV